jgi:hypothetical protein
VRRDMKPDASRNADAESDGGQRRGIPHSAPVSKGSAGAAGCVGCFRCDGCGGCGSAYAFFPLPSSL